MNNNPWRTEIIRFIFVLLLCIPLYQLLDSALLTIFIILVGYLLVFFYHINKALSWLKRGMPNEEITPEGGGVINNIMHLAYSNKKASERSYEKQQDAVQQFTDIISAIPSATIILNDNNIIEWANYPALLLLGIDNKKDSGVKIDSLIRQSKFIKHLSSEGSKEFEIASPIDSEITLAIQVAEYSNDKRLLLAHNISTNIDNQKTRKTFIANASHELKTPLTVISGYLEFIQNTPNLPASLDTPVSKALEQSNTMRILIEDLLILSRLENQMLVPSSLSIIDLKSHLQSIVQSLEDSGKLKNHIIHQSVEDGLSLGASLKELDSICYNLINNAIKYSEKGTEIHIQWAKKNKNYVQFSVIDEGIGIAPEHIAHLTERFYRVDSGRSRRVGGTGLGLSIAKHITERHKGQMEISSRLGTGSTFSVILPTRATHGHTP